MTMDTPLSRGSKDIVIMEECCVCYEENERVRRLFCKHTLCLDCGRQGERFPCKVFILVAIGSVSHQAQACFMIGAHDGLFITLFDLMSQVCFGIRRGLEFDGYRANERDCKRIQEKKSVQILISI